MPSPVNSNVESASEKKKKKTGQLDPNRNSKGALPIPPGKLSVHSCESPSDPLASSSSPPHTPHPATSISPAASARYPPVVSAPWMSSSARASPVTHRIVVDRACVPRPVGRARMGGYSSVSDLFLLFLLLLLSLGLVLFLPPSRISCDYLKQMLPDLHFCCWPCRGHHRGC